MCPILFGGAVTFGKRLDVGIYKTSWNKNVVTWKVCIAFIRKT